MILLAIETASTAVGAALAEDGEIVGEVTLAASRDHAEQLHPAIESLLSATGIGVGDLGAIAIDVGPGLFTGIRVGVAAAKGFAMALAVPVVAVTSLQAIELAAREGSNDGDGGSDASAGPDGSRSIVVPVVDLRRREVAWSLPGGQPRHGAIELLVDELLSLEPGPSGVLFGGDGALRHRATLSGLRPSWCVASDALTSAPVASVAQLALAALARGAGGDALSLEPCYLRPADVRINWTTRHDAPGTAEKAAGS